MLLWIMAAYCVAAVIFYGYLVKTAQPDPYENGTEVVNEDERAVATSLRKAA